MAELPPPPAGDPLRGCSGAGRPSARADSGPGRRGARPGRSVPGGGEAHGQPRRPLTRVRARALGPPLEAARRCPLGFRGATSAGPNGCHRRLLSCGGGGRVHQGAGALRDPLGPGRWLLRPQSESLRATPPDRLFRLETAARHQHYPRAGRGVRHGGCIRQRLSLCPGRLPRGAYGAAPADRALAGGGHRVRRRPLEPGWGPHGLHSILGRAVHLLHLDRPRRRRPYGVDGDDLPGHRDRRRALLRVVAAAVRSGRGRRGRLLAGGGQAKRDREHGARVDAPLHTPFRRRAGHVFGDPAMDRTRSRHRAERAHRLRPAPGGGPWPSALFRLRPGPPLASRRLRCGTQVVLVVSALLADAVALWAIAARISEFGFSPNRVAALGENLILLVNLAWSAVLYIRFLRGRGSFTGLERWQTDYLPVYALWAAIVVIVFPPVFGYT